MSIHPAKIIGIINELCGTNYSSNCKIEFLSTEHFELLGDFDKSSVRGDLVIKLTEGDNENKVVIELQSTQNKNMGFRMFIYSINVVDKDTPIYAFPDAFTIYTHIKDDVKTGFDDVHFKIKKFSVNEQEFSSENDDLLTISFPFVNLLAMDYDEFSDSLLEPLKVLYPYKYRKNIDLIKNTDEFQKVMNDLDKYVKEQDVDKLYVAEITGKILKDLVNICMKNPEEYKEELEIMENVNKSSIDILMEEVAAKTTAEVTAEVTAKVTAKTNLSKSIEIAKNLLDILDNTVIAMKTGLSLKQVEELRAEA